MQNTTTTPTCEPSENTDGTKKVTVGPDVTNDASTNMVYSVSHNVTNMGLISYFNVASSTSSQNGSAKMIGGEQVDNTPVNVVPISYAIKLSLTSSTMANLWKFEANMPKDVDYDVWLPLTSVHEFSSSEDVDSVLREGPWVIRGIPIFLNKWSPSVSLLKEELSHVPVGVRFHDVPLVAYTSDGLSLMATKIGNPMMLDSYTNFMCLESWGRETMQYFRLKSMLVMILVIIL
ncbi:zinc knuckle CX2CX4HX4C containing protein [Tanacetum coccineum]